MKQKKCNILAESLNHLLDEGKEISIRQLIDATAGRGQAALLILFVLPFCQPITIPGLSTPFGLILMFIGLRIAFGHRVWIPKMLLDKKIPHHTLKKITDFIVIITNKLSFFTSTRLTYFVNYPPLHIAHGIAIAILALLLSLPLPIPFTNLLAAWPILLFGLALLEDDGVLIIIAYFLFYFCLGVFASLLFFSKELWMMF
jgi:hypothetical protein